MFWNATEGVPYSFEFPDALNYVPCRRTDGRGRTSRDEH
jgi:hypothetical protein